MALFGLKGSPSGEPIEIIDDGKTHSLILKIRNKFTGSSFEPDTEANENLESVLLKIQNHGCEILSVQQSAVKLDNSASGQQGLTIIILYKS